MAVGAWTPEDRHVSRSSRTMRHHGLLLILSLFVFLVDSEWEWVIGFPTALLRNLAPLKQRRERIGRKGEGFRRAESAGEGPKGRRMEKGWGGEGGRKGTPIF
jgi:hypothetical protein